jgi:tetratricopeptide (TPR) repeat protein
MRPSVVLFTGVLAACGGGQRPVSAPGGAASAGVAKATSAPQEPPLVRAERLLATSEYRLAEAAFRDPRLEAKDGRVALGLAETLLAMGRYSEVLELVPAFERERGGIGRRATLVAARALVQSGRLSDAEAKLRAVEGDAEAREARLLLGEVLLELGRRKDAEPRLRTLIEDYNESRIAENDGHGLALVGRAAHLLRSPRDANEAFGEAEGTGVFDRQLLLWRAELFLEKYDAGHAEEVLSDILERAPHDPDALVMMAEVRLVQAFDFVEAERLARAALAQNPRLARAYFVLGGIALRDVELADADQHIRIGLGARANDLDLLSLRATVRFVASDRAGFDAAKKAVFALNPERSRFYAIVGDFADWEHRYDEIVELMQEAVVLDPNDATALAGLGINLIRAGRDADGTAALGRAFALDPYNARVFNTLELFEKVIPKDYVSVKGTRFTLRYHVKDKPLLERYVPALLERAWTSYVDHYGFTPKVPVGVELYADREHFAIRTSGLPETAIQGVCFGHTLASMSPQKEKFNLGMTVWHELAHVFHIQLSKNRVPRWFTEGLAEYETTLARPEWSREQGPELFELRRAGRLPSIVGMNRAFTRAEQLSDMATAYYASSKLVAMLGSQHGMRKMGAMLRGWADGKATPDVFRSALALEPGVEDDRFRALLDGELSRYKTQFVPMSRVGSADAARAAAKASPKDAVKQVALALALFRAGAEEEARAALKTARTLDPRNADARYLAAKVALATDKPADGVKLLREMLGDGQDGYVVQMELAEAAEATKDEATRLAALLSAERFDPTQTAPLYAMLKLSEQKNDADRSLALLKKLALLSEHDPTVHRELVVRLVARGAFADAVAAGEAAIFADITGFQTHRAFAEALIKTGDKKRAIFELVSAMLCDADPVELAAVRVTLEGLGGKAPERHP